MAIWIYEKKDKKQVARENALARCFDEPIENCVHSLVREAVQNSLDGKDDINKPVKVRFYTGIHSGSSPVMSKYITPEAWKHFHSPDNKLNNAPNEKSQCRFLVYEDFNATGLTGDVNASDPEQNQKNNYYYFYRCEANSAKDAKDNSVRGRHGIGKHVFPLMSSILTFLSVTVRKDDNRCLIKGKSILRFHKVDGETYTPDLWYGAEREDDGFPLPVEDDKLLSDIQKDFNLKRTKNDYGLSIVMPYVSDNDDISVEALCRYVIREYSYPILKGQLVFEIEDANGVKIIEDYASIYKLIPLIFQKREIEKIKPCIDIIHKSASAVRFDIPAPSIPGKPIWDENYINDLLAASIRKALEVPDSVVCVRAHINLEKDSSKTSYFDMYLSRVPDESLNKAWFIREGINIIGNKHRGKRGHHCVVVVEDQPLGALLGDSENPAHTFWSRKILQDNYKGKYVWGPEIIKFVIDGFSNVISLLDRENNEKDCNILSEFFSIKKTMHSENTRHLNSNESDNVKPLMPKKLIQPKKTKPYKEKQIDSGLQITGNDALDNKRRLYKVIMAYAVEDCTRARSFMKFNRRDFDFGPNGNIKSTFENAVCVLADGQNLHFTTENNNFKVTVTGFDVNRQPIHEILHEIIENENA